MNLIKHEIRGIYSFLVLSKSSEKNQGATASAQHIHLGAALDHV